MIHFSSLIKVLNHAAWKYWFVAVTFSSSSHHPSLASYDLCKSPHQVLADPYSMRSNDPLVSTSLFFVNNLEASSEANVSQNLNCLGFFRIILLFSHVVKKNWYFQHSFSGASAWRKDEAVHRALCLILCRCFRTRDTAVLAASKFALSVISHENSGTN